MGEVGIRVPVSAPIPVQICRQLPVSRPIPNNACIYLPIMSIFCGCLLGFGLIAIRLMFYKMTQILILLYYNIIK